jgi:hypothetical protein
VIVIFYSISFESSQLGNHNQCVLHMSRC